MARTTTAAVRTLLGPNYDGSQDLQQYVDSAAVAVSRAATLAARAGQTYAADELELMERWLAAWFYTQTDPMYLARRTGDASGNFRQASYLDGAKRIDPFGYLSEALATNRAGAVWVGTKPDNAVEYEDR